MDLLKLKKEDFENLPSKNCEYKDKENPFHSFILIPTEEIHDSEWGCIKIVGIDYENNMYELTKWSDVIHLDGIGGYGLDFENIRSNKIEVHGWSIDLLPCGYFRLWSNGKNILGSCMSSFEIYGLGRER